MPEFTLADRPKGKPLYIAIADHIESMIVSMELEQNRKLPTTADLAKSYGVTIATAQQALSRLCEKGMLRRVRKSGTFVNNASISRCVAITFPFEPFDMDSRFYGLLLKELQKNLENRGMSYILHFGLIHEQLDMALRKLKAEVVAGEYCCMLAVAASQEFSAWSDEQKIIPCFVQPAPDLKASCCMGLTELLRRGYRKIGFVSQYSEYSRWVIDAENAGLKKACEGTDFAFDDLQFIDWGITTHQAYQGAREYFSRTPRKDWPDVIFSHHDVVTKGLLLALSELGLKIPKDISLLTHSNQGDEFSCSLELSRLEFKPSEFAEKTVSYMLGNLSGPVSGLRNVPGLVDCSWIEGQSLKRTFK